VNKKELIGKLKESRKELMEAVEGLTEADMERKDILDWTLKEVLIRILGWDHLTLQDAKGLLEGKAPKHLDENLDHDDEKFVAEHKNKTPSEILDAIEDSTEEVVKFIDSLSDEDLNKDRGISWEGDNITVSWLMDYSDHDRDIIKRIWEWRMKKKYDEGGKGE
jgi:hypothetical protein